MAQELLSIKNLSIGINGINECSDVVNGISFGIKNGEIMGIVGESGCGKSITALSIMGLLPKNAMIREGSILFNGIELSGINKEELRKIQGKDISIVFQEPMTSLNPLITIGKQVGEVLKIHFKFTKLERKTMVIDTLKKVGLKSPEELYDYYPHQLSGGMRQRVIIAMAIICRPKLIIADEPTTALDVTVQDKILDLLKEINREFKTTILFISHDLSVINKLCDNVVVMYAGDIVEEGITRNIFNNPVHEYTKGLIGSIPSKEKKGKRLVNIKGKVPSITIKKIGCGFAPRCDNTTDQCFLEKPQIIEIGYKHKVACYSTKRDSDINNVG
ncbi:ABC transporter ATP-binding protein [Clostridium akagii]|uniref:ABC transporter ATP-binding protein n=1 Tax=Clostridium akagii TaxID=91623 RepID=UPI0004791139|nr:ABC transporter ATP-binding protein [Clostridium akagii]